MVGEEEKPDMDELREKAEVIAEATGRSVEAIIEDLLDDGIVNLSNEEKNNKDLVEQLKEAAELITTVQAISQEVSDNTVLNGGENKTDIVVETTLEGDVVDRAIESLQLKADNIKKLVITLAPIFLLLTGGSMEAFGIIDIWDSESEDDDYDPYYDEIYGCTAPDAENYMVEATMDDGSCYWDDNNGGGGGPPPANCQWTWSDTSFLDNENFLVIRANFGDDSCPHEMEGRFIVELHKDDEYQTEYEWDNIKFKQNYEVQHSFSDLESGIYRNHFIFEAYDGSSWNWDSPETHEVYDTSCYSQTELDNPSLSAEGNDLVIDMVFSDLSDCGQDIQINIEVWRGGQLYDTLTYGEVHEGVYWIDSIGDTTIRVQGKGELMDIPDGDDWTVKARYRHANADDSPYESEWFQSNSIVIDEIDDAIYGCTDITAKNYDTMATDDDGSCEYPPDEPCEVEIQNHYRGHVADDEEQDAILIAFRVAPSNCEGEKVEIDIELYQDGYDANYTHWVEINGDNQYTDISHTFDGVAVGNSWTPRITATLDGEQLEQVLFWGIDVEEQEPETCEINLFGITLQTNNTTATVAFDLDCGYYENDLEGYNVSVQFLIYHVNEKNSGANGTGPLEWTTQLYFIEGYADDIRTLALDNFTVENTTHYDFYWYAIWTDADGNQQFIEQTWLNRELSP